ncbi:hypothetical protein APY94_10305 [Thermococcus celericrescens]|uniref:Class III signal peptide-containing protein n=1 Tax=Thermococcus celericrescens TaxID=227598 RepID=A0A100XWS9_9EURY|nr:class III signal peptide-containing protein [Thermococcus celericrescens]KUH32465.1 hypothetical protein APY94_10305 [Thermococcus celericrescens]
MFRLRRKKGQGAIEYLFMIAAALVIILIAVRYVGQSTGTASQQADIASLQSQAELAKSTLTAAGVWNDNYNVKLDDTKNILSIENNGNPVWNATATHESEYESLQIGSNSLTGGNGIPLSDVYNTCSSGGDNAKAACYVLADLGNGHKV